MDEEETLIHGIWILVVGVCDKEHFSLQGAQETGHWEETFPMT